MVFAIKFFFVVGILFFSAWLLLGLPAVTREVVNGSMCTRIDSEFLRNLDVGILDPGECGEAGVETWFKGLIPTVFVAGIFMFFLAWLADKRKPEGDYSDLL